ncbi:MAG: CocE/NonD family hydrolase [Burkholderiales bacterium]|nr:CocE/NonD family hydrolase [Burkholderiales bacterium]
MKTITDFPHRWTETDDCWIPMPDGVKLAAKLWLPESAASKPVPTIIEVLPYRKRDIYAPRDAMHHRYFAGHGYACMRVDIRGSGDSDGVQGVFAMKQEQDDTLEVLKWIAAQPWSDGQVGMFGISWGGFQAIQTAYRAPKELKAIVPCSYAPDRYTYSQVFRGGSVLLRSIRWSTQMFGYKSRPPDPLQVGDKWRAMWLARLESNVPQIISALQHQNYSEYWKSRAIDFDRIKCPFYAVSGWADSSYVGAVGETLKKLKVPRKGLIGPWGHRFAHLGVPGPAIGFLQETLRWFDHWMRGKPGQDKSGGIMKEPMLTAWMPQAVPAKNYYAESPGRWVAEPQWPSSRIKTKRLSLNNGGQLGERAGKAVKIVACTPQTLGLDCGELMPWFQHGASPEMPGDQRADDGKSICFDGAPLAKTTEILGTPVATLTLSVDRPTAFICVRLCDVAPDGASTRVTYGVFNLTHLNGADKPIRLKPGQRYTVRVPLADAGYSFVKGHRLRVAVSTTYWPLIWPSPEPVTLTLHAGKSFIELPVRPPRKEDAKVKFKPVEAAPPFKRTPLAAGGRNRVVRTDMGKNETIVEVTDSSGRGRYDEIENLIAEARSTERYRIVEGDPLACEAEVTWTWLFERGDWGTRTEMRTKVACDKKDFIVTARLEAYERNGQGDKQVFARDFSERIRRNGN